MKGKAAGRLIAANHNTTHEAKRSLSLRPVQLRRATMIFHKFHFTESKQRTNVRVKFLHAHTHNIFQFNASRFVRFMKASSSSNALRAQRKNLN